MYRIRDTRCIARDLLEEPQEAARPHLDPHAPLLIDALSGIQPRPPAVPFYSTASDDPRKVVTLDGAYWAENLRKPVRFADTIKAAAEDGHAVFLEVSVHPIVGHAMRETLQEIDSEAVIRHTIRRESDDLRTILGQLAHPCRPRCTPNWSRQGWAPHCLAPTKVRVNPGQRRP